MCLGLEQVYTRWKKELSLWIFILPSLESQGSSHFEIKIPREGEGKRKYRLSEGYIYIYILQQIDKKLFEILTFFLADPPPLDLLTHNFSLYPNIPPSSYFLSLSTLKSTMPLRCAYTLKRCDFSLIHVSHSFLIFSLSPGRVTTTPPSENQLGTVVKSIGL